MSYTVVGLFRNQVDADQAKTELANAGFGADRVDYSTYKSEGVFNEHDYEYKEDEQSKGFWAWLFDNDNEMANRYSRIGSRSHVLTVHAEDNEEAIKARDIMDSTNALDPEEYDAALTEYSNRYRNVDVRNEDFDKNIEVIREEMRVGKREVQTGGMSVRSRIVEKPVEATVRLKDERVYLKRTPVDRLATEEDFKPGAISMKEYAERPVVEKEARVVEEIEINKEVDSKEQVVKDTVRETEVDIEEHDVNVDTDCTTDKK